MIKKLEDFGPYEVFVIGGRDHREDLNNVFRARGSVFEETVNGKKRFISCTGITFDRDRKGNLMEMDSYDRLDDTLQVVITRNKTIVSGARVVPRYKKYGLSMENLNNMNPQYPLGIPLEPVLEILHKTGRLDDPSKVVEIGRAFKIKSGNTKRTPAYKFLTLVALKNAFYVAKNMFGAIHDIDDIPFVFEAAKKKYIENIYRPLGMTLVRDLGKWLPPGEIERARKEIIERKGSITEYEEAVIKHPFLRFEYPIPEYPYQDLEDMSPMELQILYVDPSRGIRRIRRNQWKAVQDDENHMSPFLLSMVEPGEYRGFYRILPPLSRAFLYGAGKIEGKLNRG